MNKPILLLLVLLLCTMSSLHAQQRTDSLVQLSGVVYSEQAKEPVAFAGVNIKNTFRSTVATVAGFYTIAVQANDTIEFSSVGFKPVTYVVKAQNGKAVFDAYLPTDTIRYEPLLPSREQFRQAFLSLRLDETFYDLARKNLDDQQMAILYRALPKDGREQSSFTLQQLAAGYYYAGGQLNYSQFGNQAPIPLSLLSPVNWVRFIKAIQDGSLLKKDPEPPMRRD